MPAGMGYDPSTIAAIISQMRGQLGYGGAPAISRLTGPPAYGRTAQGRSVVERDGRQGVMGRGGRFQVLGPSALGRLGRPGAESGGAMSGGLAEGPAAPIVPPVEPSLPMEVMGGDLSGGSAASMEKPLFGLRGSGPVPPGAPPNPASRIPFPPTGGGMTPVGPGAAPNVGGIAGPPSMPSRGMGDKLSSMTGGGLMSGGVGGVGGMAGGMSVSTPVGGTAVNPDIAARRALLNNRLRSMMLPATAR